jgi:hypothetical protein
MIHAMHTGPGGRRTHRSFGVELAVRHLRRVTPAGTLLPATGVVRRRRTAAAVARALLPPPLPYSRHPRRTRPYQRVVIVLKRGPARSYRSTFT